MTCQAREGTTPSVYMGIKIQADWIENWHGLAEWVGSTREAIFS